MTESTEELTHALDERKIVLEEKKFDIEIEKLKIERLKAWTTGGSIVISLLIAAITIGFGVWSQHRQVIAQFNIQDKQAKSQLELAERSAKSEFEIKAAEIVMSTNAPGVTRNKANAMLALFPNRLPPNFAASFDASKYTDKTSRDTVQQPAIALYHKKRRPEVGDYKGVSLPLKPKTFEELGSKGTASEMDSTEPRKLLPEPSPLTKPSTDVSPQL